MGSSFLVERSDRAHVLIVTRSVSEGEAVQKPITARSLADEGEAVQKPITARSLADASGYDRKWEIAER
jgi:hypothetical protein